MLLIVAERAGARQRVALAGEDATADGADTADGSTQPAAPGRARRLKGCRLLRFAVPEVTEPTAWTNELTGADGQVLVTASVVIEPGEGERIIRLPAGLEPGDYTARLRAGSTDTAELRFTQP